jgi:hypothetical protein
MTLIRESRAAVVPNCLERFVYVAIRRSECSLDGAGKKSSREFHNKLRARRGVQEKSKRINSE